MERSWPFLEGLFNCFTSWRITIIVWIILEDYSVLEICPGQRDPCFSWKVVGTLNISTFEISVMFEDNSNLGNWPLPSWLLYKLFLQQERCVWRFKLERIKTRSRQLFNAHNAILMLTHIWQNFDETHCMYPSHVQGKSVVHVRALTYCDIHTINVEKLKEVHICMSRCMKINIDIEFRMYDMMSMKICFEV